MKYFTVERSGSVEVWKITNPPMNYMTAPMCRELLELIGKSEHDSETRAIIVTGGVEDKFITHYSVEELAAAAAEPAQVVRTFAHRSIGFHRMLNRLMMLPKAVIAAINGDCMGGGYELALSCDLRVAADGPYQIGLPEAILGIIPGGGGTQRLPRLIGRGRALEAMLFGTVYNPREAERIGMVNRVVAPNSLMELATLWAQTLAKRPPKSVAAIKRAVHLGLDRDLESGLMIERSEMVDVMCSEDALTLMNAYNAEVAKDPMGARSNFLNGIGVPDAKGR